MTLRDALAAAHQRIEDCDALTDAEVAEAILSDPGVREALEEAVAEGVRALPVPALVADWWAWTIGDARVIVARMLSTGSEEAGGGG